MMLENLHFAKDLLLIGIVIFRMCKLLYSEYIKEIRFS